MKSILLGVCMVLVYLLIVNAGPEIKPTMESDAFRVEVIR